MSEIIAKIIIVMGCLFCLSVSGFCFYIGIEFTKNTLDLVTMFLAAGAFIILFIDGCLLLRD